MVTYYFRSIHKYITENVGYNLICGGNIVRSIVSLEFDFEIIISDYNSNIEDNNFHISHLRFV